MRKGEGGNEQTDRETYPAQHRDRTNLNIGHALGQRGDAQLSGQPGEAEHAELLADEQSRRDASSMRAAPLCPTFG